MERTISVMTGKGSITHNERKFTAKNVDESRSVNNIEFCNEDIKEVYHKLFDEALERFNAKQTRKDRRIDDYYEKIRTGKQEKLFHEVIFQIGNKDDMNARSPEGQLAKEMLVEFMQGFQERNPNLYVFSAHLHMDEETPHLHVDFVPFVTGSKRGLDTRVSLKSALKEQGFEGGTRSDTELNQWVLSEKQQLAQIMERHEVKWLQKGTHEKHLSVLDFEKQERAKEAAALNQQIEVSHEQLNFTNQIVNEQRETSDRLDQINRKLISDNEKLTEANETLEQEVASKEENVRSLTAQNESLELENGNLQVQNTKMEQENQSLTKQQQDIRQQIDSLVGSKKKLERNVRAYDEDPKWQAPEPTLLQSAKAYRDKLIVPFVAKLKDLIKNLTIRCVQLTESNERLEKRVKKQDEDIDFYKGKISDQYNKIVGLEEKSDDLDRVKSYLGEDKTQAIIDSVKKMEQTQRMQEQQKRKSHRGWGR